MPGLTHRIQIRRCQHNRTLFLCIKGVLCHCRRRNALDIKLFEYAKQLMKARREALAAAGKLQQLPVLSLERSTAAGTAHKTGEVGSAALSRNLVRLP